MSHDVYVNMEPLPGYRLIEQIGTGGYGEVWRAEAPGGLTKAIKFVFGQHHEKRATNEIRAIDRVRTVRHPFLLSLERIEVVDGRLLVVTELADGSLKDRFDACRRTGMNGIPRDELLGYLRDAADALDFMIDLHALQHLDIKPENLLLLAGHVKVADFGLVKDVRQSQASLVGGMTPLYAAPEVFRGAPSSRSDQYSLAIVYTEMLTGTLAFAGGNAAELTLQHLNDEPNLSALCAADRYPVSRALAKDPSHRYASCRDFVDALFKASATVTVASSQSSAASPATFNGQDEPLPPVARETLATDLFDDDASSCWSSAPAQMLIDAPPPDGQMRDLPPIDMAKLDERLSPVLVLGIGGSAGRVLAHVRRGIRDQFGGEVDLPAIQFLLLDTDPRALTEVTQRDGSGLYPEETLNLSLRRPQHYREQSHKLLNWLSRRWLYNIPKSLRTEGLRPLGRLALVDHARQTGQRIRRALEQAVEPESLAKSAQVSRMGFRDDTLRVFLVASISGGTGSGMSVDVAYMIRAVLEKLGRRSASITGLMLHATGGDPRHTELARVNAFAWLAELNHFAEPGSQYPGDPSCGLPQHSPGVPPFDHTYLVHVGENVDAGEFDQAIRGVADYLRQNLLSTAGAYLDACRRSDATAPAPVPDAMPLNLRSFGVAQQTAAPSELCEQFAKVISQRVLASWLPAEALPAGLARPRESAASSNYDDAPDWSHLAVGANQLVRRLQIDSEGLTGNARALVELQLSCEPLGFLQSWIDNQARGQSATDATMLHAMDTLFSVSDDDLEDTKFRLLGKMPTEIVQPLSDKLRADVRRWIADRVDDPRDRLAGARRAIAWLNEHTARIEAELRHVRQSTTARFAECRQELMSVVSGSTGLQIFRPGTKVAPRAAKYFGLCLDQLTLAAAVQVVRELQSDAKSISDEIIMLSREIGRIVETVGRTTYDDGCDGGADSRLWGRLRAGLPTLVAAVDKRLQAEFVAQQGGLLQLVMQGGRPRAQMTAKLHDLSRQAVHDVLAGVDVLEDRTTGGAPGAESGLRSSLAAATPSLLSFGGTRRVLTILPHAASTTMSDAEIAQAIGTATAVIRGNDNNLTLCVEAAQLSLLHVALGVVQRRRDRVEFAERVHCRTDIRWTPLVRVYPASLAVDWDSASIGGSCHSESNQDVCKTVVM